VNERNGLKGQGPEESLESVYASEVPHQLSAWQRREKARADPARPSSVLHRSAHLEQECAAIAPTLVREAPWFIG
jgi:hypothetical protein